MSSPFLPVVFILVSGWVLDASDSLPTLVRISREVHDERIQADTSVDTDGQSGNGSSTSAVTGVNTNALALFLDRLKSINSSKIEGSEALHGNAQGVRGKSASDGHEIGGNGEESGTALEDKSMNSSKTEGSEGVQGNYQGPRGEPPSGGLSGNNAVHSTSSAHSASVEEGVVAMEHQSRGKQHQTPSGGHSESPAGAATASGEEEEIMAELLEIWAKIGGPEMLGKIAAMSGNIYGAGTGVPYSSSPSAVSPVGTGSMGGNSQYVTAGGFASGGTGHFATAGIGAGGNTSQPAEVVYVMMVPGYGAVSQGRGGYTTVNTAGTYRTTGSSTTPAYVSYMAIPVGSVTTRGRSLNGIPIYYGGTARRGGATYKALPVTYGNGASRQYSSVAYIAVPVGQVVSTRGQQGVARSAATYYTLQGGRMVATSQQRPAAGGSYAAVQTVVLPAQAYKVVSG